MVASAFARIVTVRRVGVSVCYVRSINDGLFLWFFRCVQEDVGVVQVRSAGRLPHKRPGPLIRDVVGAFIQFACGPRSSVVAEFVLPSCFRHVIYASPIRGSVLCIKVALTRCAVRNHTGYFATIPYDNGG